MPAIKKARYSEEPVFVNTDGTFEPYISKDIITNRDAYAASLHLVFKHVADFHTLMVEIIAEKTGLDSDAIIAEIRDDKRFTEMIVSPQIHSMGLIRKEDISKVVAIVPVETVETITESMSTMKVDEVKKPKVVKVVKKKAVT